MNNTVQQGSMTHALEVNRVLRNTYFMLALTLVFSAITATMAVVTMAAPINILLWLIAMFGLQFLITRNRNNVWGVAFTFLFTGFMGWTLGPILNFYIHNFSNGGELIMLALGSTGLIFFGLSAIALNPKRNFSHWIGFLSVGIIVAFIAMLANLFLHIPALYLAVSIVFAFIAGGLILWQTNMIVHGGERNYLMATVTLYISIYNLFLVLLQIFGMFGGNRN